MAATSDVTIRFKADVGEAEAALERCVALAERFTALWGEAPRPDGLERVEYQPGDVIILRCESPLGSDETARVKAAGEAIFPGATVAVLSGGLSVETVIGGEN